jgi:large subunit ribosomal protein L25
VSEVKLAAEPRTEFGKGAARRLRRSHKVPAVLYGHGTAPIHVTLEGHATMLALKQSNALFTLDLDGETHLALPKDVQRDPLRGIIEHVDLLLVRRGERVTVEVPVHVVGEPVGNAVVINELSTLTLEVEATSIPKSVELSIDGTEIGTRVHANELPLPEGAVLITDAEAVVVQVSAGQSEDTQSAGEAGAGEAASAE